MTISDIDAKLEAGVQRFSAKEVAILFKLIKINEEISDRKIKQLEFKISVLEAKLEEKQYWGI